MDNAVLLDTSFLIHLLNEDAEFHAQALDYFKYYLQKKVIMKISTVTIGEYCVRGDISDLPIKHLQVLTFDVLASQKAAQYARIIFDANRQAKDKLIRSVIKDDVKLFAHADLDVNISGFVTSDIKTKKAYHHLMGSVHPRFQIIDIQTLVKERYGMLF